MALAELAARISADISDFKSKMATVQNDMNSTRGNFQQAGKSFQQVGQNLRSVGAGMTAGVTAPVLAAGTAAIMTGANFESAMSEVQAVTMATGKDFTKLQELAQDLGSSTKYSATEAAQGMAFLGRAGFDTTEIMSAMPVMLDLATAGNLDLARAADISSNILSAFGMEASQSGHMADVLAFAAANANTSVEQMGYAMGYVGPVANSMGISVEETAAAVGILSDAGIQGERAGTALRGMLSQLTTVTGQTKDTLAAYGLTAEDVNPKTKSLAEIIQTLKDAGVQASDAMELVGQEAGPGLAVLLEQGSGSITNFTGELKTADGAASEMATTMGENTKGGFKEFLSSLEALGIAISEELLPVINPIIDGLTQMFRWFSQMNPVVKQAAIIFALVVSAIGPIIMVVGGLIGAVGALATTFAVSVGTIMSFIGVAVAVVAGITALVAAFIYAYNKVGWFRDRVNSAWERIKSGFQAVVDFLRPAVQAVVDFVVQQWDKIKNWWGQSGGTIMQAVSNVWNFISTIISTVMSVIWGIMQFIWPAILFIIQSVWGNIKAVISSGINIILAIIDIFTSLFTGNWSKLWESVKSLISNALTFIWNLFQLWGWGKLLAGALRLGAGLLNAFKGSWTKIWNVVKSIASKLWNWLKSAFNSGKQFIDDVWKTIGNVTKTVWNGIKSALKAVWNVIKTQLKNSFNFYKNLITGVWNGVKSVSTRVWNGIKSFLSNTFNAIKSRLTNAWNAIKSATSNAWSKVKSYISNVGSNIKSTLSGLASKAKSWGRNLLNMFIKGIKSKIRAVVGVVSDVAGKVKGFLGFSSPTKEGPASKSDKWAPNFMGMFAGGLEKNIPALRRTAAKVAGVMEGVNVSPTAPRVSHAAVGNLSASRSGYVSPADRAEAAGGVVVTGNTFNVRQESDIDSIARAIDRKKRNKSRARGRVTP
ncbi:phage tail tape measure protein [Paludifilum halophilum]|uniref:Phage tail tape measure protein n=1 Tax=Paludifilum halophilum TaxID=1642702 RepID=A0A235B980_9BACL|nr:phage tail tape measure protein [Paludifilum halophilum]OYD08549.1 phage tail tape measure protein [Paludifilum halophilum]